MRVNAILGYMRVGEKVVTCICGKLEAAGVSIISKSRMGRSPDPNGFDIPYCERQVG